MKNKGVMKLPDMIPILKDTLPLKAGVAIEREVRFC